MCPQVSENPKRGYFWVWKCSKDFPYKLMLIAPSPYIILVYERFYWNFLLLDNRENLYVSASSFLQNVQMAMLTPV